MAAVEKAASQVLEAREKYPRSTLAQMYDPNNMPADLRAAHNALDRAVEALYGLKGSSTEAQRPALLLTKYHELAPTLGSQMKPTKACRKGAKAQAWLSLCLLVFSPSMHVPRRPMASPHPPERTEHPAESEHEQ